MHRFILQLLLGPQATGKQNDLSDQVVSRRHCMWGNVTSLVMFLDAEARPNPLRQDFQGAENFKPPAGLVREPWLLSRAFFEHKSWFHAVSGCPAHSSEWSPLPILFNSPHKLSSCSFFGKDTVENSLNIESWFHFLAILRSFLSVTVKLEQPKPVQGI